MFTKVKDQEIAMVIGQKKRFQKMNRKKQKFAKQTRKDFEILKKESLPVMANVPAFTLKIAAYFQRYLDSKVESKDKDSWSKGDYAPEKLCARMRVCSDWCCMRSTFGCQYLDLWVVLCCFIEVLCQLCSGSKTKMMEWDEERIATN